MRDLVFAIGMAVCLLLVVASAWKNSRPRTAATCAAEVAPAPSVVDPDDVAALAADLQLALDRTEALRKRLNAACAQIAAVAATQHRLPPSGVGSCKEAD